MKVKKVIIEGFHNVAKKTYDFDDITYLHGRNGAGKSTVLQAIQLGLLGYVPGTNKTKQGVFTHANGRVMAIKLILDNNGQEYSIQRIWTKVKTSVTEDLEVVPAGLDIKHLIEDLELPLFNFDEFTHMTANTLKDWFINYLPKSTFKTDWSKQLKDSIQDLPESAVDETLIDESVNAIQAFGQEGVDEVRSANSYFKNQLSFLKSELTRKTSTIQSLIHYDDYVAQYTEEELKQFISSTENSIVQASLSAQYRQRRHALTQELKGLEGAAKALEAAKKNLESVSSDYDAVVNEQNQKESTYREKLAEFNSYSKIVDSSGICIFTNKKCDEISSLRDTYMKRQNDLQGEIDDLADELNELQKRKQTLQGLVQQATSNMSSLENDVRRYFQVQKELEGFPEDVELPNVEVLQCRLEEYKEMYGKAVANRQYNELNEVVLQDKYRIENTIECLKLWVKLTDVNGLQAQTGDTNPFEMLADNIDEVLKKLFSNSTARCKFNSDGKANSFSFGIGRNDIYVPYTLLSSGEKCLFILSMFIGLLNYSKSPLKLILIDDFLDHLDDDNFKSIFDVLNKDSGMQFIFAGVKPVTSENCKVVEVN